MRRELTRSLSRQEMQILQRAVLQEDPFMVRVPPTHLPKIAKVHPFNKYLLGYSEVLCPPRIYIWLELSIFKRSWNLSTGGVGGVPDQTLGGYTTLGRVEF